MDKVINSHIDKVEALHEEFNADLDSLMGDIKIKEVIKDAQSVMAGIASDILELFKEKYALRAAELGIQFAEMIQGKIEDEQKIKLDDTN
jgi:hypothetical protein